MKKIISTVSDGVTIRKAEGSLNGAEIVAAIKEHSPSLSTSKVIWDFTNAYARNVSPSDLKEIATIAIATNSQRPTDDMTAVIFSSELELDLGQQVGKYLANNKLPYKFELFTDMHEALLWLYTADEIS